MNEQEPLIPDEPFEDDGSTRERADVRAQRRRMIRTILVGAPAVVAASAGTAHAGWGYGYKSTPTKK